jgi:hypothetical protein
MVYWMEKPHAIGARHDAVSASDAPLPVHHDDPVRRLVSGTYRTHLDAGRLFALVAELWDEKGLINFFIGNISILAPSQVDPAVSESVSRLLRGIGEYFSLFGHDISFNPGPGYIGIERDFVFQFACLDTEAAADALVCIYEKHPPAGLRRGMYAEGPDDFIQPSRQCYGNGSFDSQF